jgi:hypothetical protein
VRIRVGILELISNRAMRTLADRRDEKGVVSFEFCGRSVGLGVLRNIKIHHNQQKETEDDAIHIYTYICRST